MLIGRRNYLRIVHAGFVCRNGGFHVLFRAAGTTFRDKVNVWSVISKRGREARKNDEQRKRERKGKKKRQKKVAKGNAK